MPPPVLIHIQRGNQRFGPYPLSQVVELLADRRLQLTDQAWHDGMSAAQPLATMLQTHGVAPPKGTSDESLKWLLPVGRSGWAIAAGYAGLFALLVLPGPIALFCGIMALRDFKRNPGHEGRGRAWFGLVMGAIATTLLLVLLAASLAQ